LTLNISADQKPIVETARRIGEKYGLDYWRRLDKAKEYPREFWREVCSAGLCGIAISENYGGAGLGMLEMAMVIEALCAAGGGSTLSQLFMLNPIFGGIALSKFGSDQMKADLIPGLLSGDVTFCMALTEPDAGSNTLSIKTFARQDGKGWRLSGQKIWITCVPQAKKMLVVARTKKREDVVRKTDGISLFIIDVAREGLSHTSIEKLGTNTLPSSTVFFDDVRIDEHELIGDLHGGWHQLLDVLNTERIVTTAGLVGTAELATKLAVEYANGRTVFGEKPISSYQAIQFPLAEAYIEYECARLMNYQAASLCDQGQSYGSQANMAKWLAARAASHATDRAIQTMGGMGFATESHVERLWRDARLFRFAPVSEEMVLNYVAQHDLGMMRSY